MNNTVSNPFDAVLECMEDVELESHVSRMKNYSDAINIFHNVASLDGATAKRLLAVCLRDLTTNLKYSSSALAVVGIIATKIKEGKCYVPLPELLPSALAVLNMVKNAEILKKVLLRSLSIDTLLSFPDETLIDLVTTHSKDVLAVFDCMYCKEIQFEGKFILILSKLLKILPEDKKTKFVKEGVDIWFRTIIPIIIWEAMEKVDTLKDYITCLELLTDSLENVNYAENPHWLNFLKGICDQKKYPLFLKSLVDSGNDGWHRLWVVFIKLLKDQITKVNSSGVSPINALLPVVELAFKLDSNCRCHAFECWKVLIDNFSRELNESLVNKRLKLLIIPLKLNNAKVEETVLAKFNTWWHLIKQFHGKMDKLTDTVLIPFLHFCFGKSGSGKPGTIPGQLTHVVATKCLEAFVEITGHVGCEGCVRLPRLNSRLINTKLLAEHWNDWVHSLSVAIKCNDGSEITKQQKACLWKSFIMTIGELPENQIRADLFNELLKLVESFFTPSTDEKLANTAFNILISSLFDKEPKIRKLLKTKTANGPLHMIIAMLTQPNLNSFYSRQDPEVLLNKLKLFTNVIMDGSLTNPEEMVGFLLEMLPIDEDYLPLWVVLSESVCESKHDMKSVKLSTVVLWPLKNMNIFSLKKSEPVWYKWYTLYSYMHPMMNDDHIDKVITNILLGKQGFEPTNSYFSLCASLALLKQKLVNDKSAGCDVETEILQMVINKIKDHQLVEQFFPILLDTLILLLNKLTEVENLHLAEHCLGIVNVVLDIVKDIVKSKSNVTNITFIDNFLKAINTLFQVDAYASLQPTIVDVLMECGSLHESSIKKDVKEILQTFAVKSKKNDVNFYTKVKTAIDAIDNVKDPVVIENNVTESSNTNNFPTPVVKKKKKKQPDIVNTVTENGEEFVVVKSHWKFNPKKLTEAQKERMKRKREDIPALYQDLSQSQDEFKLTTWKTDSQDASTTSSKSNSKSTNDDFTTIFKNIPSTDVVPKIMENILPSPKQADKNHEESIDSNKPQKSPAVKEPRTPRLALKDRVFKNVRNLIEKGCVTEGKVTNDVEDMNQTLNENELRTPINKAKVDVNVLINSAPPKIVPERPSRSIKKPKKFDDSEVFALKRKRRKGSSQADSDTTEKPVENANKTIIVSQHSIEETVEPEKERECMEIPQITVSKPCTNPVEPVIQIDSSAVPQSNEENKEKNDVVIIEEKIDTQDNQELHVDNTPKEQGMLNDASDTDNSSQIIEEIATPKPTGKKKVNEDRSTIKKKRSRIEKQLLIDMVEGHPLLQTQSEKRLTRKADKVTNDTVSKRRKSLIEKSNKIKAELHNAGLVDKKVVDKKEKNSLKTNHQKTDILVESQESLPEYSQDFPLSEDVIESSQDSTLTTISVKSTSKKKVVIVRLDKLNPLSITHKVIPSDTQNLLNESNNDIIPLSDTSYNQDSREDIELPKNKTMVEQNNTTNDVDLTESMDTEPIDSSGDVIIINEDVPPPIVINTEDTVGKETQEMAEADTLPMEVESASQIETEQVITDSTTIEENSQNDNDITNVPTQDVTPMINDTSEVITAELSNTGSPFKDEDQRKKDFLNDTIEISPIKTMSPIRDKKTPSPETSKDYVVIKLTSPVQSNGEPFNEKSDSPEIFSEDKVSPDKRDQSPPRKEVAVANSSPSSSLSLKKSRPQMRFTGRAALILGLAQDSSNDATEIEDTNKGTPVTPARKNLRTLYNTVGDIENQANNDDSENSENFLKFKRTLPTPDCSPSVPILKRKLIEIADEATVSPANKRKRVSFHDPPVLTTVSVQKYIEPGGIRSPQNSAIKRQERRLRALIQMKSPKRLDKVFKLDNILNKAVESFSDEASMNDTVSLDDTPAAEVVKTSDLNDTDSICPELLNCKDPIGNIASDLSSPSTKELLIKELQGKVETIADLAKMSELEVNRLCIKAPKIQVVKKVLKDYSIKKARQDSFVSKTIVETITVPDPEIEKICIAVQTMEVPEPVNDKNDNSVQTDEKLSMSVETQTLVPVTLSCTQTDAVSTTHISAQTNESGNKTTKEVIATCLTERPDFVEGLKEQLDNDSVQRIAERLPLESSLNLLTNKITPSDINDVLNRVLFRQGAVDSNETRNKNDFNVLQEYLCSRFNSKDLILFCSHLLQKIHDKTPAVD